MPRSVLFEATFDDPNNWHHRCVKYPANGGAASSIEVGNIFVPGEFNYLAFLHGKPVDHDSANTEGWCQPEGHHESIDQYAYRVHDGYAAWLAFGYYHIIYPFLVKEINVPSSGTLTLTMYCHGWSSNGNNAYSSDGIGTGAFDALAGTDGLSDDQRNVTFGMTVGDDPFAGDFLDGARHIYNKYAKVESSVHVDAGTVKVNFGVKTLWRLQHNNAYFDSVLVEFEPDEEDDNDECRGKPREQYKRTCHVYPTGATKERRREIAEEAVVIRQQTCTPSYDDAGIGDLDDKVAVLWDIKQGAQSTYRLFFEENYPGTAVEFEGNTEDDESGTTIVAPLPLQSDEYIGLHAGFMRNMTMTYLKTMKPNATKFFTAGDCYTAWLQCPNIITDWRRYVGNESGFAANYTTVALAATALLDLYTAEIEAAAKGLGISVYQLLQGITTIESLNETIPTYVPDTLKKSVEFDVAFAEAVYERYGSELKVTLLNGAVGNPHESEVPYLIPAAEAAVKHGGFLGYHSYWGASEETYIESLWPYHAGRAMEWDKVFVANGLYPYYLSTESGVCKYTGWFDPTSGWKSVGSFLKTLADIRTYNTLWSEWNKTHGNRFAGMVYFGYGNWGWSDFELGDGEISLMMNWEAALSGAAGTLISAQALSSYEADLRSYLDRPYLTDDTRARLAYVLEQHNG